MICACPACGENNSVTAVDLQIHGGESKCVKCTRLFDARLHRLPPAQERRYKRECAEKNNEEHSLLVEPVIEGQLLTNQFSCEDGYIDDNYNNVSAISAERPKPAVQFGGKELASDSVKGTVRKEQSIPWPEQGSTQAGAGSKEIPTLDCSAVVGVNDSVLRNLSSVKSNVNLETKELVSGLRSSDEKSDKVRRLEARLKEEKIALEYHKLQIERNKLRLEQQKIELQKQRLNQYQQRQVREEQFLFQQDTEYQKHLEQFSSGGEAVRGKVKTVVEKPLRTRRKQVQDTGSIYRNGGRMASGVLQQTNTAMASGMASAATGKVSATDSNSGVKLEMTAIAISESVIRQSAVRRHR